MVVSFPKGSSLLIIGLAILLCASARGIFLLLGIKWPHYINLLQFVTMFALLGACITTLKIDSLKQGQLIRLARANQVTDVYGTVAGEPEALKDFFSFTLKVDQIRVGAKRFRVSELARVSIEHGNQRFGPPAAGEEMILLGVTPLIPSSQRYRQSLYIKGIQVLLSADVSSLRRVEGPALLPRLLRCMRQQIESNVLRFLSARESGLLLGIMLGDKGHMTSLMQSRFTRAGVAHVMVVSGLHVGMIALIAFWLARLCRLEICKRAVLTMVLVAFYALISGCRPSVLRAALVIGISLLGWLLGREKHLIAALSTAGLVLLVYDPFLLFEIAFQLSFIATLSIAVIVPLLQRQLEQFAVFSRRPLQIFLASIAVQVGVVPVLMYHFGELSLISAFSNVVIVPLIGPVLALGLVASCLSAISCFLAQPLFAMLGFVLGLINRITTSLASLSFSSISAMISLRGMLIYYILLAALVIWIRRSKETLSRAFIQFVSLLIPVGIIWWQILVNGPPAQFTAHFLDVGQGDAAAIRSPTGATILVDGGPDRHVTKNLLASRGIRRIDLLVLSHPHADHINGLVELVEGGNVGLVLMGKSSDSSPEYSEFRAAVSDRAIPKITAKEGMKLQVGPDLLACVLSDSHMSKDSDLNNESLVLKIEYGDLSLLFAGDVEEEGELDLLGLRQDLRSSILKVPHHGSDRSADRTFLKSVKPKAAIISAGKDNRFGHPSRAAIRNLKSLGTEIYRTDQDGNVTITSDGKSFAVKTSKYHDRRKD